jgi:CubicO group peptidase (beta-lactamase class C family)
MVLRVALLVLLFGCSFAVAETAPAVAAQAPAADPTSGLDRFIREGMTAYGVPGASVAVVYRDKTIFLKGYGTRRVGERAPVDENTVFQIASDTKTFTAAALAALVGEGRLDWDDEVITKLPEFALYDPYPTRHATVRDLLAHRTGLPAFTGDLLGEEGYDRREVLRRIRFVPPAASFRERALYSNLGFFAAGEVAARVAGTSWEDVVRSRLLRPLGMSRSATSVLTAPKDDNRSGTFGRVGGRIVAIKPSHQIVMGAAGSMVSTALDLSRYMRMLLDGGKIDGKPVLSAKAVEEMFQPSIVSEISFTETLPIREETGFGYGMGWGYYYFHGSKVLEKGGALDGARAIIVLVPERQLGIAVLANRNLTILPEAIRAYVLEQELGPASPDTQRTLLEAQKKVDMLLEPDPAPADPARTSVPLAAYAGTYESDIYGPFVLTPAGDELKIGAGPVGYAGRLRHFSRDTFTLSWPLINYGTQDVTFTIGPDGTPTGFITETLGNFERIKTATEGSGGQ